MAWGFLDWVRGRLRPKGEVEVISLSGEPTEEEVRGVVMKLLESRVAYQAYQVLDEHRELARPLLEGKVRGDLRFRSMDVELRDWGRPVYDVMLTILFKWGSPYAVEEALVAAKSSDARLRGTAGRLLADTGEARFAGVLVTLAGDAKEGVRESVMKGVHHVLEYGKEQFEPSLGRALYEPMLACALRTDQGPGIRFARALFAADRERAMRDFGGEDVLRFERTWLRDLLETLPAEGVDVPQERVERLLMEAIEWLETSDASTRERFGTDFLIETLLVMLVERNRAVGEARIQALRFHADKEVREGVQMARARVIGDPLRVVCKAMEVADYDVRRVRREHQVVWLVHVLEAEVSNGGWLQWVANSSGQFALETLAALREIGAEAAALEMEKLMAAIGPEGWSPEQKLRMAAVDRALEKGREMPGDSTLWEMRTELNEKICDYGERHHEAFREG